MVFIDVTTQNWVAQVELPVKQMFIGKKLQRFIDCVLDIEGNFLRRNDHWKNCEYT